MVKSYQWTCICELKGKLNPRRSRWLSEYKFRMESGTQWLARGRGRVGWRAAGRWCILCSCKNHGSWPVIYLFQLSRYIAAGVMLLPIPGLWAVICHKPFKTPFLIYISGQSGDPDRKFLYISGLLPWFLQVHFQLIPMVCFPYLHDGLKFLKLLA